MGRYRRGSLTSIASLRSGVRLEVDFIAYP